MRSGWSRLWRTRCTPGCFSSLRKAAVLGFAAACIEQRLDTPFFRLLIGRADNASWACEAARNVTPSMVGLASRRRRPGSKGKGKELKAADIIDWFVYTRVCACSPLQA
jgi:hypothetical protein